MPLKKFLIVDDDERFALLAAEKLKKFGKCYVASNGEEALLYFHHHVQEGAPFDVVFMDIEMPGMTGHEVVQKMRTLEKEMNTLPNEQFKLVMISAHSDIKNVSVSFFRDWADAYIPKVSFQASYKNTLKDNNIIA